MSDATTQNKAATTTLGDTENKTLNQCVKIFGLNRERFIKYNTKYKTFMSLKILVQSICMSTKDIVNIVLNIFKFFYSYINNKITQKRNVNTEENSNNITSYSNYFFIIIGIATITYSNYIVSSKNLLAGNINNTTLWIAFYVGSYLLYEILKNLDNQFSQAKRNHENKEFGFLKGASIFVGLLTIIAKWMTLKVSVNMLLSKFITNIKLKNSLIYIFLVSNSILILLNVLYRFFPDKGISLIKKKEVTKRKNSIVYAAAKYFGYFCLIALAVINAAGIFAFEFKSLSLAMPSSSRATLIFIITLSSLSFLTVIFNTIDIYLWANVKIISNTAETTPKSEETPGAVKKVQPGTETNNGAENTEGESETETNNGAENTEGEPETETNKNKLWPVIKFQRGTT